MCTVNCILFGALNLSRDEVVGKRVIEVGSFDENGSLRPLVESMDPSEYIGVDIVEGPGVDMICDAIDVLEKFGPESFDIVLSTEMIEHVRDWRKVVSNLKGLCRKNGFILITTRSVGFGYHSHPHDFWRYEVSDLERIFSDCEIVSLQGDKVDPGAFIKVRKPSDFREVSLNGLALYSVVNNRRTAHVEDTRRGGIFLLFSILANLIKDLFCGVGCFIGKLPGQYAKRQACSE